jgi:hypothetical protein
MVTSHGNGPKFIYVRRYARWVNGERLYVESYFRGWTPPLYFRDSDSQLDFGF